MKSLLKCLEGVQIKAIHGDPDQLIQAITLDSREAKQGSLFIAIPGTRIDGHKFIDTAIQKGAKTIVCEVLPAKMEEGICYIQVKDSKSAAGQVAHQYYGKPSTNLALIGVTGTNGKSTVATLLYRLFERLGYRSGLITTIEYRVHDRVSTSTHTTPGPVRLNALLAEMCEAECRCAVMEVSSHAMVQERTAGLKFKGGVFTNISHDHLDYHKTFQAYIEAKKKYFDGLGAHAFALINADDPRADFMVQNTTAKVSKYSLRKLADYKAKIISSGFEGLELEFDNIQFHSRLAGRFNAYNLLAAFGVAMELGLDKEEVIKVLSDLYPAEGRFDVLRHPETNTSVIVDYAHTPDALQKVMSTIHQIKRRNQRLIVVVGCGGDRDVLKRPKMARIAFTKGDVVVMTSDNPRSEDPEKILDDMLAELTPEESRTIFRITDRNEAIKVAIGLASPGDIILIAGKGHEKYQEIKGKRFPFDDKEIAEKVLLNDI